MEAVDQIGKVVELLQRDPQTRQAIISIWDPAADWVESKDIPCNNWLHFIIRDGRLYLNVMVRSNDVIFGFSHCDFFCWSVLQQMMAHWVGVEVGPMIWNATSFHVYERHYELMNRITWGNDGRLPVYNAIPAYSKVPEFDTAFQAFDDELKRIFTAEANWRADRDWTLWPISNSPLLIRMTAMLRMYNHYLHHNDVDWLAVTTAAMYPSDLKLAAMEFFWRKVPGFINLVRDQLPAGESLATMRYLEQFIVN